MKKAFGFVACAAAVLLCGCAGFGDKAASAAAAAASIAAPEYAETIQAVKERVVAAGGAKSAELSAAEIDAIMRSAGFVRVYAVFFDGIVVNDLSRFSFREAWERSGTGATVDPAAMVSGAEPVEEQEAASELDARIDAVFESIGQKQKAK